MTERQLRQGKAVIMQCNNELTIEENSKLIAEFYDYVINDLMPQYNYDYVIHAYVSENTERPFVIACCKGKDELLKIFEVFSKKGLVCDVIKCKDLKREIKLFQKNYQNTRMVLIEKIKKAA
jgi:hypothetical protein